MIPAEDFIDLLEKKGILPSELIETLRSQVTQSMAPVSAALVAKRLVDKGHLSDALARRLLDQVASDATSAAASARESLGMDGKGAKDEDFAPLVDDEDPSAGEEVVSLDEFAPLVDDEPTGVDDDYGLEPIGAKPPKTRPTQAAGPGKRAEKAPSASPSQAPTPVPAPPVQLPPVAAGPMSNLLDDTGLGGDATSGGLLALGPKRRWFGKKRPSGGNVWDSKLLLVGGGALMLLLILGGVLTLVLTGRTGDDMLQAADDAYRAGSYTAAISAYTDYLNKYPNASDHSGVSLARVRRGLARMRQATSGSVKWPVALRVAQEQTQEISGETEFDREARPELKALLPEIAEQLANESLEKLDLELASLASEALELTEAYIPGRDRPTARLHDIQAVLDLTHREVARGVTLAEAVAKIRKAVAEGRNADAYVVRRDLLKQYSSLFDDASLLEAIKEVSAAEKDAVQRVQKRQVPVTDAPSDSRVLGEVALAARNPRAPASDGRGHTVYALAMGSAYGLDAADGRVLWRRHVGFGGDGRVPPFPPTPVATVAGADAILVDHTAGEVLRVAAADGIPRWRHPINGPFSAYPVVAGEQVLVSTQSGHVVLIDLETGVSDAYMQLPQSLGVAPAVDLRRATAYQPAEHSNLYVLSLQDGAALQTVYLGHEPGSIIVPPVVINQFLVVTVNDKLDSAKLKVFSLEPTEQGDEKPLRLVQEIALSGTLGTPPVVSGAKLLLATDQGRIHVFEVTGADADEPLRDVASGASAGEAGGGNSPRVRFPFLLGGEACVADSQLTKYDIQTSRNRLNPKWIADERSATLQPPSCVGQTVYHVRSQTQLPGVVVTAVALGEGNIYWETRLAAPMVGEPIVDPQTGQITAVTAAGAVLQVASAAMVGQTVVDQPIESLASADVPHPLSAVIPLGGGLLAMAAQGNPRQAFVFDPLSRPSMFRRIVLPGPLACPPVLFDGTVVTPTTAGQVLLFDPRTTAKRCDPFQPSLASGVAINWRRPAVVDDKTIAVADGVDGLYLLSIKDQPRPHLSAVVFRNDLPERITSPLAILGQTVYAIDASPALLSFDLPELGATRDPRPLGGSCVWGPQRVGNYVALATDDDLLHLIDAEGNVRPIPLTAGPLAGTPLALDDGQLLLAFADGTLWWLDPAVGRQTSSQATGLPLATGCVLLGADLLVGLADGSLVRIKIEQ